MGVLFPWKSIWGVKAPQRVSFFVWSVAWGRIVTCKNLTKLGYVLAGRCCLCRCSGEIVDHLLLHSSVATEVWSFVFHSIGVEWVLLGSVMDYLYGWRNWFGKHSLGVWNLVPLCMLWTVWQECNRCNFEDLESSMSQIIESFIGSLSDWSRTWGFTTVSSLGDFLESLGSFHYAHLL